MRLLLCITTLFILIGSNLSANKAELHSQTNWNLQPSFKYDALCFLNIISADPFYTKYYKKDFKTYSNKLTPEAKIAITNLKRVIKDEQSDIISAALCWYFSALPDSTLDQLINTTSSEEATLRAFTNAKMFEEKEVQYLGALSKDMHTVFSWMKQISFDQDWETLIKPKVEKKIEKINKGLPKYNVIHEDEVLLGTPLKSNIITVNLLYYCQPHGIRITGIQFLTDQSYPFETVIRNAAHEMMHPPFDLKNDTLLVSLLNTLKQDSFLMDKVEHHNPSFGYNSFLGFVEEDCVQAIEQLSCRNMDIAIKPQKRWKHSDDGMHVLAVAIYSLMLKENYNSKDEVFRDFLVRLIQSGKLAPGNIKNLYDDFYRK